MVIVPQELLNSLSLVNGFDQDRFIECHLSSERLTSIRLNPFKKSELAFNVDEPVAWSSQGFYLEQRPYFTHDPLFHSGCYYVQEAGSMFIEYVLKSQIDLTVPLKVLDLCAAPGGKATHINSLLSPNSLLVANEFIKSRSQVLSRNLSKWGSNNTIVTNNDPQVYNQLPNYFDVVVTDVPCSGSGLFRKQPEAVNEWSLKAVEHCVARQKDILEVAINTLKPGGILIYSTCSFSPSENEEMVSWLIENFGMNPISIEIPNHWGIVQSTVGFRFFPYLTKSEGFYLMALMKNGEDRTKVKKRTNLKYMDSFNHFFQTESGKVAHLASKIHFCSESVLEFMSEQHPNLFYRKAGICVGEMKGKDFIPDQELAWCIHLTQAFKTIELDKEQAICFLKKKPIILTEQNVTGLHLVTYQGHGLGWVKILANRVNNYLPSDLVVVN